jgi:hypothetical protein
MSWRCYEHSYAFELVHTGPRCACAPVILLVQHELLSFETTEGFCDGAVVPIERLGSCSLCYFLLRRFFTSFAFQLVTSTGSVDFQEQHTRDSCDHLL